MPLVRMQKENIPSIDSLIYEQAKAEAIFKSIGEGVIATDETGKISRVNRVALHILGYAEKELIGQWFPKVIGAYDAYGTPVDLIDRPISKAFINGAAINDKTFYKTKAGSLIPVAVSVSPIMMHGYPLGAVEIFRDISIENEIDRMKSEFISLASHQLRTPLSAINSYVRMLGDGFRGPLNEGQLEYVNIIVNSIDRMNELINSLLNVSKIEAGKMEVNMSKVDATGLIRGIIDEQVSSAKQKDILLKIKVPSEPFVVVCDPLLMREVCVNLLSNAIKYTPENGRVSVRLSERGGNLAYSVRDTGYGIPLKAQVNLFTKFFRAENILDKDTTGTGLGLYMVKQITDMLGGTLHFKSQEGSGSMFMFKVPIDGGRHKYKIKVNDSKL